MHLKSIVSSGHQLIQVRYFWKFLVDDKASFLPLASHLALRNIWGKKEKSPLLFEELTRASQKHVFTSKIGCCLLVKVILKNRPKRPRTKVSKTLLSPKSVKNHSLFTLYAVKGYPKKLNENRKPSSFESLLSVTTFN